jgi:hypothetical protein
MAIFIARLAFVLFQFKQARPQDLWTPFMLLDRSGRIGRVTIIVHDPAAGVKNHVLS